MSDNATRLSMHLSLRKSPLSLCIVFSGLVILFFAEYSILRELSQHFLQATLRPFHPPRPASTPSSPPSTRLHFILPAQRSDINVCKALTSSFILNYPLPTLIGWNSSTDESHLSKIVAVNAFLHTLNNASNDNDLLLMVDSLDTWFQLPVSILLSRYHASNTLTKTLFSSTAGGHKQSIILAAEKKCWPASDDSLTCSQAPDPPLPRSLFGTQTDELRSLDSSNPYQSLRPRYLNSGFLMGPVREIRELYTRVEEKVAKGKEKLVTDQGGLGRVFAEQEVARGDRWARDVAAAASIHPDASNQQHDFDELGPTTRNNSSRPRKREYKEPWHPQPHKNYEFGIGLDYTGSLSATTQWSWTDAEWVTLSNITEIQAAVDRFRITNPRIRPGEVPSDLRDAGPPFQGLSLEREREIQWEDVSLYTNLWTGVVPVSIHHNARPDGERKVLRDERWGSMWFAGNARRMFDERVERETAESRLGMDGGRRYRERRRGTRLERQFEDIRVRTLTLEGEIGWVGWSEMCGPDIQKVIFG